MNYTLVMKIEVDAEDAEEIGPDTIRTVLYDAGGDFPFSFDIVSVEKQ
jgi:hypothetical protein